MTKVVYNACFGGFGLSPGAVQRYAEIKGIKIYMFVNSKKKDGRTDYDKYHLASLKEAKEAFIVHYSKSDNPALLNEQYFSDRDISRTDPALVQVVEELGTKVNGFCAQLAIADVPSGTHYRIDEYDGHEQVISKDSYNWDVA